MNRPDFEACVVRVKVSDIGGITITKAQRITEGSIAVQCRRTIDDFVFTVAIQVTDNNIEVALAKEPFARSFGLVEPALFQFLAVKVVSHHIGCRIVTTGNNQARVHAIEVSRRRQEAVAAVAVVIAPVEAFRIIGAKRPNIARRDIVDRRDFGAIATPEHRQVFRTRNDYSRRVAVILGRVPDNVSLAVDCTVAGLHDNFGLAVTIVVIHLERRVVRASADVPAEAYAPKLCTVEFIGIEENRSRIRTFHLLRIVLEVVRHPLHDKFVFAIAIQVTDTHVVGSVTADSLIFIRHHLAFGAVQFEDLVRERLAAIGDCRVEIEGRSAQRAFRAVHDCGNGIFRSYLSILVKEVRAFGTRNGGYFFPIAVKVEFRIGFFRSQETPRDEHPGFAHVRNNKSPIQSFHLARVCKGEKRKRKNERRNNRKNTWTWMFSHNCPLHFMLIINQTSLSYAIIPFFIFISS